MWKKDNGDLLNIIPFEEELRMKELVFDDIHIIILYFSVHDIQVEGGYWRMPCVEGSYWECGVCGI